MWRCIKKVHGTVSHTRLGRGPAPSANDFRVLRNAGGEGAGGPQEKNISENLHFRVYEVIRGHIDNPASYQFGPALARPGDPMISQAN